MAGGQLPFVRRCSYLCGGAGRGQGGPGRDAAPGSQGGRETAALPDTHERGAAGVSPGHQQPPTPPWSTSCWQYTGLSQKRQKAGVVVCVIMKCRASSGHQYQYLAPGWAGVEVAVRNWCAGRGAWEGVTGL